MKDLLLPLLLLLLLLLGELAADVAPEEGADDDDGDGDGRASRHYCFSDDPRPYVGFAALTPYAAARPQQPAFEDFAPEGCQPVQLWHLIRHGSRVMHKFEYSKLEVMLPTLKRMILKSHSYGNGELCPRDLALLRAWRTSKLDVGDKRHLTPEGRKEIEGIALRFKAAFPELVYKPYHVGKALEENERGKPGEGTKLAFAPSFPTYDSAVTYLETLYGRNWGHVGLDLNGSPALQYFYFCRNYISKVLICSKKKKPFHNFITGKFMEGVISRVSKRLGVTVTIAKLRAMYNACRYQKAWRPEKPSAWCACLHSTRSGGVGVLGGPPHAPRPGPCSRDHVQAGVSSGE
ncbi:multiple inositol polyphosphate phosphatase 1-like [Penaeus monodon]|uniref:multiple inositol polyphosphate phosphatase 1-like n=1 Tax=Penaeus monodon TaxID=6687 RepID=UPI0018A7C8CB|nr:multiple inositol polyphosphate phosphatase 1-like [Penaeus monodon]